MAYAELKIRTTEVAADAVGEALLSEGALGLATQDPAEILRMIHAPGSLIVSDDEFESSLPDHVSITAYFPSTVLDDMPSFRAGIERALDRVGMFLPVGEGWHSLRLIEEEDWANSWKRFYKPIHISRSLVVCPSWETYEARQGELVIRLDPGMAFGTGSHASTMLAAELLDDFPPTDKTVLDVGTGSGILSIAAVLLGAASVDALDIDPEAVAVATANAIENRVDALVNSLSGELKDAPRARYDVILMNIVADVISSEALGVRSKLKPDGLFICSGIVDHKEQEVLRKLQEAGLEVIEHRHKEGWNALLCKT